MPVFLSSATLGNNKLLLNLGQSGEIMGWYSPHRDYPAQVYQCMPCIYIGDPGYGSLQWTWGDQFQRNQHYLDDSNVCITELRGHVLTITLTDVVPLHGSALIRKIHITSQSTTPLSIGFFHFGDWHLDGMRTGNGVIYDPAHKTIIQRHRNSTAIFGGTALETWQCGKAGRNWSNNSIYDLEDGWLNQQDLEIGDVNWAFGRHCTIHPGDCLEFEAVFITGEGDEEAWSTWEYVHSMSFDAHLAARVAEDSEWLKPGREKMAALLSGKQTVFPPEIMAAFERSLLCLPLLCGEEGVAVAAPEFDQEFVSCGGYGYFWPRDGAEYVSGLMDAGYPAYAKMGMDWCARHQDKEGLWHQRYFLNGQQAPNWCLPPEHLQVDQVGATLWALGKWEENGGVPTTEHLVMLRKAADYLLSRLTKNGVHGPAFDTWETFIGSFTYSNAATWAGLKVAARLLGDAIYADGAARVKTGMLSHFVHNGYLVRGFNANSDPDYTIDSSSLGAIEPFGFLDLNDPNEMAIAEATLRSVIEHLECDFEGGRAIRRFQGDAYVGGVPACVNTLWMARCCCTVAKHLLKLKRNEQAQELVSRAQVYLTTVLQRTTPVGLFPELMAGPEGQRWWAAPHGWAMASYVTAALKLAEILP